MFEFRHSNQVLTFFENRRQSLALHPLLNLLGRYDHWTTSRRLRYEQQNPAQRCEAPARAKCVLIRSNLQSFN